MTVEVLKILGSVFLGILGAGGIGGGYFAYKSNKPKNDAESKKLEADVVVTFADGWKKYADKLEERMSELEQSIETKDKAHAKVVIEKDLRIDKLEKRVRELELELERYREMKGKVEIAQTDLHHSVDSTFDDLKK